MALASAPSIGPSTLRDLLADENAVGSLGAHSRRSGFGGGRGTDLGAPCRARHQRAHGGSAVMAGASGRRPGGAGDALLPRRSRHARRSADRGRGGHTRSDVLRHRRGGPTGGRPRRGRGGRRLGSRLGIDGAAHEGGAVPAHLPSASSPVGSTTLPAPARAALGACGRAGGDRVGVARRGAHGEMALPRAQPPAGGPQRRRGRRREPAPRRLAPHGRCRAGTGDRRWAPCRVRSAARPRRAPTRSSADGAFPVCSTSDVLVALSLAGASVPPPEAATLGPRPRRPVPEAGEDRRVDDALTSDPTSLDELARPTGLHLPVLCGAVERPLAPIWPSMSVAGGGGPDRAPKRRRTRPRSPCRPSERREPCSRPPPPLAGPDRAVRRGNGGGEPGAPRRRHLRDSCRGELTPRQEGEDIFDVCRLQGTEETA